MRRLRLKIRQIIIVNVAFIHKCLFIHLPIGHYPLLTDFITRNLTLVRFNEGFYSWVHIQESIRPLSCTHDEGHIIDQFDDEEKHLFFR